MTLNDELASEGDNVLGTRQVRREHIMVAAAACGVDLATPVLHRLAERGETQLPLETLHPVASTFLPIDRP